MEKNCTLNLLINMSTERTLLVRLSGNEPNAGGDWVEYHYSPIYINTGNTGIYLEHSLEVSGETRFQSGVYAGKSLSVSGLTDTDTLYISGTGSEPQLHIYSSGAGGSGWFIGSSGDGNFVIYSSGTNTGALVIEPSGDVLITGNLNISGDATVAGTFIPLGHQSVPGNFFVGSGMSISGDLSVRSGANITGTGIFHSDLIAQEFEVSGDANLNNLNVSGLSNLSGEVKIEDNLYVSGFVEASGDIKTSGTGFFDKEVQVGPYGNQVLIDVDGTSADFSVPIVSSGEILVKDKIRVSGTAEISGETKIQNDLLVSGDLTVSGTFIRQDETINGNLFVKKTGHFASGVVSSGNMTCSGDISLSGVLDSVSGIVSSGNITGKNKLTVSGNADFGNISSTGSVMLSGTVSNTGSISNFGSLSLSGNLDVTGDAEITGDLFVHGNVYTTGSQLLIDTQTVRVADKNIELGTGSGFGGLARSALNGGGFTLKGTDGDVDYIYNNDATAWATNVNYLTSGHLYALSGVVSSGTLDVSGRADVSGALKGHSTLDISGASTLSGSLDVSGATSITGATRIENTLNVSGTTDVSGALKGRSTLEISGASTLSGTLDVSGRADVSGALKGHSTLDISGASTLSGSLDVSGATSITGATRIENTLDVSGNVDVSGSGHFSDDVVLRNTSSGIAQASISGTGSGIRVCDWIIRHTIIETDTINKSFSKLLDGGPSASDIISLNASVYRNDDSIAYSVYSVANPSQAPDGPGYNFEISYSGKTLKVVDLDDALAISDIVTVDLKYQS